MADQIVIKAKTSFVHNSPRKLRLVADAIRGITNPTVAMNYLKALPQRGAKPILKVYQQAIGNAKTNFKISEGELKVTKLVIDEGPKGPRRPDVHAHGARFDRGVRRKRMAHINLELTPKEIK